MYESKDEMVSHPKHYALPGLNVKPLDVAKSVTSNMSGFEAIDTFNIIKYICRWKNKNNPLQDVEKVIYYATDLRDELIKKYGHVSEDEKMAYTE